MWGGSGRGRCIQFNWGGSRANVDWGGESCFPQDSHRSGRAEAAPDKLFRTFCQITIFANHAHFFVFYENEMSTTQFRLMCRRHPARNIAPNQAMPSFNRKAESESSTCFALRKFTFTTFAVYGKACVLDFVVNGSGHFNVLDLSLFAALCALI